MGVIREMVDNNNIDILLVNEADCKYAPKMMNFEAFTEISDSEKKRIVMYTREGINATQIEVRSKSSVPIIAMKLATCAIIGVYNQHTINAYTSEGRKLSKKEMFIQFTVAAQDAVAQCGTNQVILMGDVNMNWQENEYGIKDWAERMNLKQVITKPTRLRSILDHIYVSGIVPTCVNVTEYELSDHKGGRDLCIPWHGYRIR